MHKALSFLLRDASQPGHCWPVCTMTPMAACGPAPLELSLIGFAAVGFSSPAAGSGGLESTGVFLQASRRLGLWFWASVLKRSQSSEGHGSCFDSILSRFLASVASAKAGHIWSDADKQVNVRLVPPNLSPFLLSPRPSIIANAMCGTSFPAAQFAYLWV